MGWFLNCLTLLVCVVSALNDEIEPEFVQSRYGPLQSSYSGGVKTRGVKTSGVKTSGIKTSGYRADSSSGYTKTKTFTKTSSSSHGYGSHQGSSGVTHTQLPGPLVPGGCHLPPEAPINGTIVCRKTGVCRATCVPKYEFPNGQSQLFINCVDGEWEIQNSEWSLIPDCHPTCSPSCQNNGICYEPNKCDCSDKYSGPQCQYENKPCLNYPAIPLNSRRLCSKNTCTISCISGHTYPGGKTIERMQCKNSNWVPMNEELVTIPNCEPTCTPPCENGGSCLSLNTCKCPKNFGGPQCQYPTSVCNIRKKGFNGGYNCTGDMNSITCVLSCPGVPFDFPPAPYYTCTYATGLFSPSPIPQCVYGDLNVGEGPEYTTFNQSVSHSINKEAHAFSVGVGQVVTTVNNLFETASSASGIKLETMELRLPEGGSCFTWKGTHYKTFDGRVYSFSSKCAHTLVRDNVDNTFDIVTQNSPECIDEPEICSKIIKIFYQGKEYILRQSRKNHIPIFTSNKKILPIPAQLPGLRVDMSAHYIVVMLDAVGLTLKWDGQLLVQIETSQSLWNKTAGLCGTLDGSKANDLASKEGYIPKTVSTLASSWQVNSFDSECNSLPSEENPCGDSSLDAEESQRAQEFCIKLLSSERFSACHNKIDVSILLEACKWDYCFCESVKSTECICDTLNVYVRECSFKGVTSLIEWRDETTCPIQCTGGRSYKSCEPPGGQETCGTPIESSNGNGACQEGCYCPKGSVLHNSECISREQCPCRFKGRDFPPGSSFPKDCNTCTCTAGKWDCTQVSCGARCSALGDPHYVTFDGKHYDFMGQCNYYLVKTDTFTIEAENVACTGSISLALNLPITLSSGLPSCTRTVTIHMNGQRIKLKQHRDILVNDRDVSRLPFSIGNIDIREASSIFVVVELPNGVSVWWDGVSRVYINVPATFKGLTKGLCGTFNENQKDDFLTPEEDVEKSIISFANKWKTEEKCNDIPDKLKSHPCDVNVQNRATAEDYCKRLKSGIFGNCHWYVDPENFYQDCLYDMCSCEGKLATCLCPMIAAYAHECAMQGVILEWRDEIKECGIHCPGGQRYQSCGNSCTRSCYDISSRPNCKEQCVEGCNCPVGEALDEHGECIPISQCRCQHDGLDFPAGYKEVRPASKGPELCTCVNALWSCVLAKPEDARIYPPASDKKAMCSAVKNFEFTTCESPEPITCKNMHSVEMVSAAICHPGCQCKEGYVLDSVNKMCVRPSECPCHHGGRSYGENAIVQSDCNTCSCQGGKWTCSDRQCAAECHTWGDSHFKTFDGRHFDYQGQCDYVLAKGALSTEENFLVSIQNVPCGTTGVSCSKSLTIKIGTGDKQDKITLTSGRHIPSTQIFKHFTVRTHDLFVIIEASDLGVIVHWDRGTRVYVKIQPRWKNSVKGLCGNYNNNEMDDYQTPSGGLTEASVKLFGDSWKMQQSCPETEEITDTCSIRPDRRVWALKKCGILKSNTFAPCHSEVPVDDYFDRCVFDTCACDQGGDCECLCTALAAYSQECNSKGIPIKWRNQELCPIQCDERCATYSPCVSSCPQETCDNLLLQNPLSKLCKEDSCIEGCAPKPCPPDYVYMNSSLTECVPRNVCKPICLEINSIIYYEGDLMEGDDCHNCFCTRGKKTCKGQPCTTLPTPAATIPGTQEELKCHPGWTEWINQDQSDGFKETDKEPMPSSLVMNALIGDIKCDPKYITGIKCRTVIDQISSKHTGLDVECSLENGLVCLSGAKSCVDFEISVLCDCAIPTTLIPTETTPYVTPAPECDITRPFKEYPENCHSYYHCVENGDEGVKQIVKQCEEKQLFNPQTGFCDSAENVIMIKPECLKVIQPSCPPDYVYDDCAIQCDKLCSYYHYVIKESGRCQNGRKCEKGCRPATRTQTCPPDHLWNSEKACVSKSDCLCSSHGGDAVKPGSLFDETECEICQCTDDYYVCDDSKCHITEKPFVSTEIGTLAQVSPTRPSYTETTTVTPPELCDPKLYMKLIQGEIPLEDEAFVGSSTADAAFLPEYARIEDEPLAGGSWKPNPSDENPNLEINFDSLTPIYGIIIKGNPLTNEYVTSFTVSHSDNGLEPFSYVSSDKKNPQIFRGSVNPDQPIQEMFQVPFEAKSLRIHPLTWSGAIALRVEIIGCGEEFIDFTAIQSTVSTITTTIGTTTAATVLCDDLMGLSADLSFKKISVSSFKGNKFTAIKNLALGGFEAWEPSSNSPSQWVVFNFTGLRNLTGITTKGGPKGWVTTYKIQYSNTLQGDNFISVIDENGLEQVFRGNVDKNTEVSNYFKLPIRMARMKIVPLTWVENIQLRTEPRGCYETYFVIEKEVSKPVTGCNFTCPMSLESLENNACKCEEGKYWTGKDCVDLVHCPCRVDDAQDNHFWYDVGQTYEKPDCSVCTCILGGTEDCKPKKCEKCEDDQRSVITSTCECSCQRCEDYEAYCSTSNTCINSTLWCDGTADCPDDELFCETTVISTAKPATTITVVSTPEVERCPKPTCPPGYKISTKPSKNRQYQKYLMTRLSTYTYRSKVKNTYLNTKTRRKGGVKTPNLEKPSPGSTTAATPSKPECPEYRCVPTKPPPPISEDEPCPPAICPPDYKIEYDLSDLGNCPRYECYEPEEEVVCTVSGLEFVTFDETKYKYDICDHILVRNIENYDWSISLRKDCDVICSKELRINHFDDVFILYPDLTVKYNGFKYSVDQTRQIGSASQAFSISRIGDSLLFVSNHYGFWVKWNKKSEVEIGVSPKLINNLDGLCGYYDGIPNNDKRKPDGTVVRGTEEFGDSWSENVKPDECKEKPCPKEAYEKAKEMCYQARNTKFAPCADAVDVDAFIASCLETTCACLEKASHNNTVEEDCRCDLLQSFVATCLQNDQKIDLENWRTQHNCPISCPTPLVPNDCYRRPCELTCETANDPNACTKTDNLCFSGCYCPPGHVRKGDECVQLSDCKDCECNVLPHLEYISYDENNFTVNGNCVYIMSRDVSLHENEEHKFQVLITNKPCDDAHNKMCVGKITILFAGRKIHIFNDDIRNKLKIIVDGERIEDFNEVSSWLGVKQTIAKHLKISLKSAQVEVSVYHPSLGVSVKVPSQKYAGKMEGLCGDCNRTPRNDLKLPNGELTTDVEEFGLSWLYDKIPGNDKETCKPVKEKPCQDIQGDDPCLLLLDENIFDLCYPLLDPTLFIDWCRRDICNGEPGQACVAIETYAKECMGLNICLNWHTALCPAKACPIGQEYNPCGTSCPKTCESIQEKENRCVERPVDGCFCPDGKVKLNDTCVIPNECVVCDEEGHHPGDKWQKDICTNCSCEGTNLKCDTTKCADVGIVCEKNYDAVKIPNDGTECCDRYTCVPVPTVSVTCEPPQPIKCNEDQEMKLDLKPDGCTKYVCECIPRERCEPITTSQPPEDGVQAVINEEGCCPVLNWICDKETCPKPENCGLFYTLIKTEYKGKCCPIYECKPPPACIIELLYTSSTLGGEIKKNEMEKQKLRKEVGEMWNDGPCRECECFGNANEGYQSTCSLKKCPAIEESADNQEYLLDYLPIPNECCSDIKRVGCKYNGKTYKINETWPIEGDYCSTMECININGDVQKKTETMNCDENCDLGNEYIPATPESKACCGSCKPVACVVGGVIKQIGEEWESPDFCIKYECINDSGSLQVKSSTTKCESPQNDDFVLEPYKVPGECCDKYKVVKCKVDNEIYEVGDSWPSPDGDKCKTIKCVANTLGEISKETSVETCNTNCTKGSKYEGSPTECCGKCVPYACVIEDELKKPGETWTSSDYCSKFECITDNGVMSVEKTTTDCTRMKPEASDEFEYEEYKDGKECCNKHRRIACKVHDRIHLVGETWPSPDGDKCKTITCIKNDLGEITKHTSVETCDTNCLKGYEYEKSDVQCCGKCIQAACVINDTLRNPGEKWNSPDNCKNYECIDEYGNLRVTEATIKCEVPSEDTQSEFVYEAEIIENECCKKYKKVECKVNGVPKEVGETWPSPDGDKCKSITCLRNDLGEITTQTSVENCNTDCKKGYKYIQSTTECCGTCVPYACVAEEDLKYPGDTWTSEDFCTKYICVEHNGTMGVERTVTKCTAPSDDAQKEFVFEAIEIKHECCDEYEKIACLINNKRHEIGETWPSPDGDKCKTFTCIKNHLGELTKESSIQMCHTNCSTGSEYQPSLRECCGKCVPVGCVVDGEVKEPGDTWYTDDNCTEYSCDEQFNTQGHSEICPNIADCPVEDIYVEGCCKRCEMVPKAQTQCLPATIDSSKTIGLIKITIEPNIQCVNKESIDGFTECVGSCDSYTKFDTNLVSFESECSCCQATSLTTIFVELDCTDGSTIDKEISVPNKCSCEGCSNQTSKLLSLTKTKNTKTKRPPVVRRYVRSHHSH